LIVTYFPSIAEDIGLGHAIYIFAVVAVIGHFLIYLYVKETKGLTLNEIYHMYAKGGGKITDDDLSPTEKLNDQSE